MNSYFEWGRVFICPILTQLGVEMDKRNSCRDTKIPKQHPDCGKESIESIPAEIPVFGFRVSRYPSTIVVDVFHTSISYCFNSTILFPIP